MRHAPIAFALALVAGAAAAQPVPPPVPAGDLQRGREIWVADGCYQCHGRQGQGGRGPTIAGTRLSYSGFERLVRSPIRSMPAYSEKVLPPQALADAYVYLKSLQGPLAKRPAILND